MKNYAITILHEPANGETIYMINKRLYGEAFIGIFSGTRNEIVRYINENGIGQDYFIGF